MEERIRGLHHLTAIAGEPQANIDFYRGVLGLRLVKRTVNFDDPGSYHLYYGDAVGSPGTILTFFAWPSGRRGRQGVGQAIALALAIPQASLGYWMHRLIERGIPFTGPERRFDEQVLVMRDPDGLPVELIAQAAPPEVVFWEGGAVPAEHAIRGAHGATLWASALEPSGELLTDTLGLQPVGSEAGRVRYTTGDPSVPGHLIDLQSAAGFWSGTVAVGTIHHLAWRAAGDAEQLQWRERLASAGMSVTPVLDRQYFHSIYFREPGEVLFEVATDSPGFAIDEPIEALGSQLMLPPWLEPQRGGIEQQLPPIRSAEQPSATPAPEPEAELAFIHRFVPAEDAGRAPTLLLLHGTGGDENDLLQIGPALYPGANLLSPRGRVLERGMPRFFRRLAEGVFDREDLIAQTDTLAGFVEASARHYGFDPNRVVAVGYSNGANIAASLLLLHPTVLAGAVLFRTMIPLEPSIVPDLTGVPIFIGAARRDELIEPEQTERLSALLEGFGAQVTLEWQLGGHALTAADIDAARQWITSQPLTRPATSLPPVANPEGDRPAGS